jgi:sucrose phosphorylase
VADTGAEERVWTSFGDEGWSEQIDLDLSSAATRRLIVRWLHHLARQGARLVRLDAVGYVMKKAGTSSFMVEPEIYELLGWMAAEAESVGLVALPEIHDHPSTHAKLTSRGFWTYDFVLPGLLLHSLATGSGERLAAHLAASPGRQFTMLDCHDGVPVLPDLHGVLSPGEMRALATLVLEHGGNINRLLSDAWAVDDVDVHQLNITYYSAVGCDDGRYLLARAIQLFAPGIPQLYYVGLLAGENDLAGVEATGDGRAINRHNYDRDEIAAALRRPLVQRLIELVRLRHRHPAFSGASEVDARGSSLRITWRNDQHCCELRGNLRTGQVEIDASDVEPELAGRI